MRVNDVSTKYWFPDDELRFKKDFDHFMAEKYAIISFYASAETRFLQALGYTPNELLDFTWLDPYVLWRMLTFSHPDYRYGHTAHWDKQNNFTWIETTPPSFASNADEDDEWTENEEGDYVAPKENLKHTPRGHGLLDALAAQFGIVGDKAHKDAMRDLIIHNSTYTDAERVAILDYCADDVVHLKRLFINLYTAVFTLTKGKCDIDKIATLSQYCCCCGIMESNGIPVAVDKMINLGSNYRAVDEELILTCNMLYPLYVQRKSSAAEKRKGHRDLRWVENTKNWSNYLAGHGLLEGWPKTLKTGAPKKDKDTLTTYSADPVVESFLKTKTARNQIKYFRPEGFKKIREHLGQDDTIRVLLSPFGSKTGRNQPSPSQGYLYAAGTWLRPLIESKNLSILGADYSAQEIALQGWISQDQNFLSAYKSGDPYTWFASFTGSLPPNTTRVADIFYVDGVAVSDDATAEQYKRIRNTFKALLLGVGYGMGMQKLATSLTASRIKGLPIEDRNILSQAAVCQDQLIQDKAADILSTIKVYPGTSTVYHPASCKATTYFSYHQETFKEYWRWRNYYIKQYHEEGFTQLADGWCLFRGEQSPRTIGNFPIQGHGAVILRRAVLNCIRAGLRVISPLHDCIYITSTPESQKSDIEKLTKCMRDAVMHVCGSDLIRIDTKVHKTDWVKFTSTYTEDKGKKDFEKFGKYMMVRNTDEEPDILLEDIEECQAVGTECPSCNPDAINPYCFFCNGTGKIESEIEPEPMPVNTNLNIWGF
jgi:hypothetical protein